MIRSLSLRKQFSGCMVLIDFTSTNPSILNLYYQRQQLYYITDNFYHFRFAARVLNYISDYAPDVFDLLIDMLQEASQSSLGTPHLLDAVFILCERRAPAERLIPLISNIIFDCPDYVVFLYDILRYLCLEVFITPGAVQSFLNLAISYARISMDREIDDLTWLFSAYLQRMRPLMTSHQYSKMCWFYIYSTRGNQVYALGKEFVRLTLQVCYENKIDLLGLEESIENCFPMIEQLHSEGFDSEYFALMRADVDTIHAMLTGNNQKHIYLAIKILITRHPQIPEEDYQLLWIILLMLREIGNDDEFEFLCENLRYLPVIDAFLKKL